MSDVADLPPVDLVEVEPDPNELTDSPAYHPEQDEDGDL